MLGNGDIFKLWWSDAVTTNDDIDIEMHLSEVDVSF